MDVRPKPFLTPKDLAEALAVSESSLKRWADDGVIPASRTVGGHRRIVLADAVRFARQSGLRIEHPAALGLEQIASRARASDDDAGEALFAAFQRDDGRVAYGLMVGAYLAGEPLAGICDGAIREALRRAGELWRQGSDGIVLEHRAVDTCLQALSFIRSLIPATPDDAPVALGGALSGDPYALPSLSAALVLADAGCRAINLGPTMPAVALAEAVARYTPHLIWRTTSIPTGHEELRRDLAEILPRLAPEARVVVGGRGMPRGLFTFTDRVHHLASMGELAGFVRGLRTIDAPPTAPAPASG
jgi:excisionase family DNA binding protein